MRTIETKVFKFNELSDKAKEAAIQSYRDNNTEYFWADDAINTLKAFCSAFDITLKDYSLGECQSSIDFDINDECAVLKYNRLYSYLINHYEKEIKNFVDCNATGYCFDCVIISPIAEFMKKPIKIDLKTLYDNCFDEFIRVYQADIEDQNSDEYITEAIENNDYEFTVDGSML